MFIEMKYVGTKLNSMMMLNFHSVSFGATYIQAIHFKI